MLDKVRRMAEQFDILHFHVDVFHYPLAVSFAARTITTMPRRLRHSRVAEGARSLSRVPFGFDFEQPAAPDAACQMGGNRLSWPSTQSASFQIRLPKGGYFAFLGPISPEKRPDLAIEIAVRAGARLKIAAKFDRADEAYWKDVIKPMINSLFPNVEFVGEIGERD